MRAVGIREFGGRDKLELMDVPEPKVPPDGVLIRVRAAGANPTDWKIREGRSANAFPHVFPVVLGWDAAGVVERVGPAVTQFAPGDEVVSYCRKHFIGEGTYAEYVVVPESFPARKPESLDFAHAAVLPLAALTAYQMLFLAAGLTGGETVLVHAAGGGVGSYAVQLAVDSDADVIGTASERNREYVLGLGATEVIDYRNDDVVAAARELKPDGVDVVLDLVGGATLERSPELLAPGGRLVSILDPPVVARLRESGVDATYVYVRPEGEQLDELVELVDGGRLSVHVSETLPLEDAARAHEQLEGGHVRGKLAIRVD